MSSISLICQSLLLLCLHSMHSPHSIGTHITLSSETGGIFPPFFLLALYLGFLISFGYKHMVFHYLLWNPLIGCAPGFPPNRSFRLPNIGITISGLSSPPMSFCVFHLCHMLFAFCSDRYSLSIHNC